MNPGPGSQPATRRGIDWQRALGVLAREREAFSNAHPVSRALATRAHSST